MSTSPTAAIEARASVWMPGGAGRVGRSGGTLGRWRASGRGSGLVSGPEVSLVLAHEAATAARSTAAIGRGRTRTPGIPAGQSRGFEKIGYRDMPAVKGLSKKVTQV